jgi:hypothetical protein
MRQFGDDAPKRFQSTGRSRDNPLIVATTTHLTPKRSASWLQAFAFVANP